MNQEDIFAMMPTPPLSRDAFAALAALDALVNRIGSANDLHAVFTIKDSAEFSHAKAVIANMESRCDRD